MSDFVPAPEGMLSEQIDLPHLNLSLGLVHPENEGLGVAAWDGKELRVMTPKAAREWADAMVSAGYAVPLAAGIAAMRDLAQKVEDITVAALFKRAGRRAAANLAVLKPIGNA